MRRNRGFAVPSEIDVFAYAVKLKQYWRNYVLVFVVGICGGYYYLLKTLSLPSTQAIVEIGFTEVSSGKYPNGRRFDKNDLISINIVRKAFDAIPELGKNGSWSPESLSSALSLSAVYPLDIQLALDALSKSKLPPQEVVSNYEKINNYFPSKFTVSFSPSPLMPIATQKKFMEELIKQYSEFVLEARIPVSPRYGQSGLASTEVDNVATYNYIASTIEEIDEKIAAAAKKTSLGVFASSGVKSKQDGANDDEFEKLSQVSNSITLQKIKMDMASAEHLIFDEKTVPNIAEYRNKLVSDISLLTNDIEIKKRQAEFKISLARIPNESAPKASATLRDDSPQNPDKTIMGILLSYNSQYYSLINETNVIFDDISRLEGRMTKMKERLKLLDAPNPVLTGTFEERNEALSEHLKMAKSHLAALANELTDNTKTAYAGYRPPVANSAVIGITASISMLKAVLTGIIAVLVVVVFRLLAIMVNDAEVQQKAAFPAPQEIIGMPKVNTKK